jgi:hypothetical protein
MRQFIIDALKDSLAITGVVGTRIYQGESLVSSELTRPFLIYRVGNETTEAVSEDLPTPHRVYFQVYIHDGPSDYTRIDSLCNEVRKALVGGPFPDYKILRVDYMETSRDLNDDTMRTIFRYIRFQAIRSDY